MAIDAPEAFGGRVGFGSAPAVLVVDAVRAYTDDSSPLELPTAMGSVSAMAEVIAAARQAAVPIYYTQVHYPNSARTDAPLFAQKVPALEVFARESALGEIHPALSPHPGDVVLRKRYASSFFGTDLARRLTESGVDTLVIVGFSTTGCVRASAVDALQYEFRPIVVADAVADRTADRHLASLADLDAKYADVVPVAEAVGALRLLAGPSEVKG